MNNRLRARGALLLTLIQIMPAVTYADDQPRADEQDAIRRVNEQIQELQAKVKELEARLNGVTGSASHEAVESSATVSALSDGTPPTPSSAAQEPQANNLAPSVTLRMFGDVGYQASDQKGATNSFHTRTG